MDYKKQLDLIRDKVHREIVKKAVSTYNVYDDTYLELMEPVEFACYDEGVARNTKIVAIDTSKGTLISSNNYTVNYDLVPVETLIVIHKMINSNMFILKPDMFL